MWYLKNLLNPRWIFDILKSGSMDLQSLWCKVKAWFWFDQQTLIIFGICFLFKCMAPSEGEGKCIGSYDNGIDNVFTMKTSDITTAGGGYIDEGIYKGSGQSMPWIDTGFETTGDQLIVYANGDYFPWGKAATEKTTTYHPVTTKMSDTDYWVTALKLSEDYQECELNTDIKYSKYDAKIVKELYENHLNKYTTTNPNNRDQGFAHRLAYDPVTNLPLPNVIQADCINHNNCEIDDSKDENPIGCVLRRGAGIYMKFGEEMPFSYHIINHDVPSLRKECDSTGTTCEYKYVTIGTNTIKTTRIPFTLPMMFYRRDELDEDIRDTQEDLIGKLVTYKQYDKETDYRFTILEGVSGACPSPTVAPEYQVIDGQCYKSVTKKLTKDEVQNYDCKKRDMSDELHPDEFCPPPKGQRIYVKFADTFYEDDEGSVDLIFTSGAKNLRPKFKYEINGFKLSWIQYIPYKLIAPFWGDQTKEDAPSVLLDYKSVPDKIEIYDKNGDAIYPTTYKGTDFIKTTRFGERGIILCGAPISDHKCSSPSPNLLVATAYKNTMGEINKIEFRGKDSTLDLNRGIYHDEVIPSVENWLIKIDRLNEGLFFKARDKIIVNPLFTFAKVFFALWFVFSFGIGILNKTKLIAMPTYTKDWKKFLILMWATDPDNYALIDDLLWPALFRYAEQFAAGILEIGSSIYGASLHYTNPYEFFDESIQMMTSKQLIYKISSLANDIIYWPVYLGWFPLLMTGIIRYVKTVISWLWSLIMVLMDLGSVIMLLPFYALISFFKSHEGTLKKTLIRILHTFTHLAFEMGFFCLLMGFVYKTFLEAIDIDICWRVKFEFRLFWIFPVIKLYAWVIDGVNSQFAAYKEIFGGLLLGVLKFFLVSFITDWSSKIAKMAADAFMPDSMARSISAAEEDVGKPLGALANSALGTAGNILDLNNIGGGGGMGKGADQQPGVGSGDGGIDGAQNSADKGSVNRDSGIPPNVGNLQPSNLQPSSSGGESLPKSLPSGDSSMKSGAKPIPTQGSMKAPTAGKNTGNLKSSGAPNKTVQRQGTGKITINGKVVQKDADYNINIEGAAKEYTKVLDNGRTIVIGDQKMDTGALVKQSQQYAQIAQQYAQRTQQYFNQMNNKKLNPKDLTNNLKEENKISPKKSETDKKAIKKVDNAKNKMAEGNQKAKPTNKDMLNQNKNLPKDKKMENAANKNDISKVNTRKEKDIIKQTKVVNENKDIEIQKNIIEQGGETRTIEKETRVNQEGNVNRGANKMQQNKNTTSVRQQTNERPVQNSVNRESTNKDILKKNSAQNNADKVASKRDTNEVVSSQNKADTVPGQKNDAIKSDKGVVRTNEKYNNINERKEQIKVADSGHTVSENQKIDIEQTEQRDQVAPKAVNQRTVNNDQQKNFEERVKTNDVQERLSKEKITAEETQKKPNQIYEARNNQQSQQKNYTSNDNIIDTTKNAANLKNNSEAVVNDNNNKVEETVRGTGQEKAQIDDAPVSQPVQEYQPKTKIDEPVQQTVQTQITETQNYKTKPVQQQPEITSSQQTEQVAETKTLNYVENAQSAKENIQQNIMQRDNYMDKISQPAETTAQHVDDNAPTQTASSKETINEIITQNDHVKPVASPENNVITETKSPVETNVAIQSQVDKNDYNSDTIQSTEIKPQAQDEMAQGAPQVDRNADLGNNISQTKDNQYYEVPQEQINSNANIEARVAEPQVAEMSHPHVVNEAQPKGANEIQPVVDAPAVNDLQPQQPIDSEAPQEQTIVQMDNGVSNYVENPQEQIQQQENSLNINTTEQVQQQTSQDNFNVEVNNDINITVNGQKYEVPTNNLDENGNRTISSNITIDNDGVKIDGYNVQQVDAQEAQQSISEKSNYVEVPQTNEQPQRQQESYQNTNAEEQIQQPATVEVSQSENNQFVEQAPENLQQQNIIEPVQQQSEVIIEQQLNAETQPQVVNDAQVVNNDTQPVVDAPAVNDVPPTADEPVVEQIVNETPQYFESKIKQSPSEGDNVNIPQETTTYDDNIKSAKPVADKPVIETQAIETPIVNEAVAVNDVPPTADEPVVEQIVNETPQYFESKTEPVADEKVAEMSQLQVANEIQPVVDVQMQQEQVIETQNYVNVPLAQTTENYQQTPAIEAPTVNEATAVDDMPVVNEASQPAIETPAVNELTAINEAQAVNDTPQVAEPVIETAQPQITEPSRSATGDDVSYTYNGNNDEIAVSNTTPEPEPQPEPQQVNDVADNTNTMEDVSYSSSSASENPIVEKIDEKHENHVENNDFKTKQENQKTADDLIKQYEEDRKRKNEGTIKADRGAEALQRIDAWTTKKK